MVPCHGEGAPRGDRLLWGLLWPLRGYEDRAVRENFYLLLTAPMGINDLHGCLAHVGVPEIGSPIVVVPQPGIYVALHGLR